MPTGSGSAKEQGTGVVHDQQSFGIPQPASVKTDNRINTLDFMRGVSMFFVFYTHFAINWNTSDWTSWCLFQWTVLDFMGITSFTGLSVLGTMIACFKRKEKGDLRLLPASTLLRALYLFILGQFLNIAAQWYMGVDLIFASNILFAIAIFSILTPLILKLNYKTRFLFAGAIIILYYPFLNWAFSGLTEAGITALQITLANMGDPRVVVYYFLFDHAMMTPLFPWLIIPFFMTTIFESLIKALNHGDFQVISHELKKIAVIGALIIACSIAVGFPLTRGYSWWEVDQLTTPGFFFTWPIHAVPLFYDRNTINMIVFNIGSFCIVFFMIGYVQLIWKKRFPWEDKMANFGRLSLTGFMLSELAYALGFIKLPLFLFYAIFIPLFILIVNAFWYWSNTLKGKFTLEWLSVIFVSIISRSFSKTRKGDE